MPSDWASLPAFDEVEVGRRHEQVGGASSTAMRSRDHPVGLVAERQPVLRLGRPGLALGVVERPLVERDDRLPRLVDDLLAELDRLGQDDLLLGGQQGDLADLLEVHPDRVVDPDHVGRERLELLRRRLLDLGRRRAWPAPPCRRAPARASIASSATTSMLSSAAPARTSSAAQVELDRPRRRRGRSSPRTGAAPHPSRGRMPASLASSSSRLRRRGACQHGLDELLVQGIGHVPRVLRCGVGRCGGRRWGRCGGRWRVGRRDSAGWHVARTRSRVWSRRRRATAAAR